MKNAPCTVADYDSRSKRRAAVSYILICLKNIRDAEQIYLDNVPDNLQNSESYEVGECAVDAFDEVIDRLVNVY